MAADVERLSAGKYLLVTTFRKSGKAVPTPVWVARDKDELIVWAARDSGKVKRIRNNGTVELAECDVRGNPRGETVTGTARLLAAEESDRARRLIKIKYGVVGRLSMMGSVIRRGKAGSVGIAISVN